MPRPPDKVQILASWWKTYVTDLRDAVDAESAEYRRTTPSALVTRRLAFVIFGAGLCLIAMHFGSRDQQATWALPILKGVGLERTSQRLAYALSTSPDRRINQRIWWATNQILAYSLIPILLIKLELRESLSSFGLRIRGTAKHAKVYLLLIVLVAPLVFAASYGDAFIARYPYYKVAPGESLWPGFVGWELLYMGQFVALELFFRGFVIQGLRNVVGYAAVFVPIVPYAMIHFQKPLVEAIGAMFTGFILGSLSLKTRSIWGGVAVHISVACSMDFLSLWHQGLLF